MIKGSLWGFVIQEIMELVYMLPAEKATVLQHRVFNYENKDTLKVERGGGGMTDL